MIKKVTVLFLILIMVLTIIPIYAEPSRADYENTEYERIFQGKDPKDFIYKEYSNSDLSYMNDYWKSILDRKEFVEGQPGSFKFTPMREEFLPTAKFKVEVVRDGKVISSTTSQDDIVKHMGNFQVGDKLKIYDQSQKGSKGIIQTPDLHIILQEPGLSYKTSPGSYNKLTPGGTTELTITKKGQYLLAMQTMLKEYAASSRDHTITYEIWSTNGAHHAWGEKQYKDMLWAGWSHFTGLTLGVEEGTAAAEDYSTIFLRSGAEIELYGLPKDRFINEAAVEYRVTDFDKSTGYANVELSIDNGYFRSVEGLEDAKLEKEKITGRLNMSQDYAFGMLQQTYKYLYIAGQEPDVLPWARNYTAAKKAYIEKNLNYKDADGNYGVVNRNEEEKEQIARVVKVKWITENAIMPVTLTSKVSPKEDANPANNQEAIKLYKPSENYEISTVTDAPMNATAPRNSCTFWIIRPEDVPDDLVDEFLVEIRSYEYNGKTYPNTSLFPKIDPPGKRNFFHVKLDKDHQLALIPFTADATPIDATVWRKGEEKPIHANDAVFKENFFRGYEQQDSKGNKYYYYYYHNSEQDGMMYPTKLGLSYLPKKDVETFLNYFKMPDLDTWDARLFGSWSD